MGTMIAEIVADAQTVIGEVAGPGVQTYGEDRVFDDVVRGFNMLFTKYPWPQYLQWYRVALDGTTGVMTTDALEKVKAFEDIQSVHRDGESTPLPIITGKINPYQIAQSSGSRPTYWGSLHAGHTHFKKRKIVVYPVTSTGFINILAKEYPLVPPATGFAWDDELELDKDLLTYAGAFMTLVGNDLNPGAAETVKGFMDMRYKDIMDAMGDHPIPLGSRRGVPNEWYTKVV